jgi:hypothetical protein
MTVPRPLYDALEVLREKSRALLRVPQELRRDHEKLMGDLGLASAGAA